MNWVEVAQGTGMWRVIVQFVVKLWFALIDRKIL
jgi:hypothetical protein